MKSEKNMKKKIKRDFFHTGGGRIADVRRLGLKNDIFPQVGHQAQLYLGHCYSINVTNNGLSYYSSACRFVGRPVDQLVGRSFD